MTHEATTQIPEVGSFHVRGLRYGSTIESIEYEDIESAIALAEHWLWEGHCADQEIWFGETRVLDHEETVARMKAKSLDDFRD